MNLFDDFPNIFDDEPAPPPTAPAPVDEQPDSEPDSEQRFNPFIQGTDTLELGRRLELRDVFEQYLRPEMQSAGCKRKTIGNVERHLRLFEQWWEDALAFWKNRSHVEILRPIVASLTIQHLTAYQQWLRKNGRKGLYINGSVGIIQQILRCAESSGLITHVPRAKPVPAKKAAAKIYLIDSQLSDLWEAFGESTWPVKRQGFRPLHYPSPMAWRCCLVLWTLYGFRTQELIPLESKAKSLKWKHIHDCYETPNPAGQTKNEWGWIVFTPGKQERVKPEPLYLPLTRHARAALEHLRPVDWKPDEAVCNWTYSSSSFYPEWHAATARAGIKPKTGEPLEPKHLRKTCSTRSDDWCPGAADYITGHASDRSGQAQVADAGSKVSGMHYKNAENKVKQCLDTIPLPACFDEILSCKIP